MSQDRSRRLLSRSLVGALLGALALLVPAAVVQARPVFYNPPAAVPDGGPGQLVRSERIDFSKAWSKPPPGTTGYRMMYTSTGAAGNPTVVSGSLLLPPGDNSDRKVVTIGIGTHGMGDSCAPSQQLQNGAEPDLATMTALLRRGYAVAVTDYQGLGTVGEHTYAVNLALGRNVLDAVRAARQVPGVGLPADGQVGITGYSEGGGAAGSAAEQASAYAPELRIVGTVAGGVLADPYSAIRLLDGNWFMALMLGGAIGYNAAYPELNLNAFLNPVGQWTVKHDTDACATFVARFVLNKLSWYTKSNPLRTAAWKSRMEENALGSRLPNAPVYLYHGRLDEALFYTQTTWLRNRWCGLGAHVRMKINPVGEHFTTQMLEEPAGIAWLADRFAGKPLTGAC